jgi:hypothetical protein
MNMLHQFTGPISSACDQYVQYLLTRPPHRSLTDTAEGYNFEGFGFLQHSPCPFQPTVIRFPPKSPIRSQVNHPANSLTKPRSDQTLNLTSGIHHTTSIILYHLSITLLTVRHKVIGLTRISRKVDLIATTVSYNSYRLHAQSIR